MLGVVVMLWEVSSVGLHHALDVDQLAGDVDQDAVHVFDLTVKPLHVLIVHLKYTFDTLEQREISSQQWQNRTRSYSLASRTVPRRAVLQLPPLKTPRPRTTHAYGSSRL